MSGREIVWREFPLNNHTQPRDKPSRCVLHTRFPRSFWRGFGVRIMPDKVSHLFLPWTVLKSTLGRRRMGRLRDIRRRKALVEIPGEFERRELGAKFDYFALEPITDFQEEHLNRLCGRLYKKASIFGSHRTPLLALPAGRPPARRKGGAGATSVAKTSQKKLSGSHSLNILF